MIRVTLWLAWRPPTSWIGSFWRPGYGHVKFIFTETAISILNLACTTARAP